MKKKVSVIIGKCIILLIICLFLFGGCKFFQDLFGSGDDQGNRAPSVVILEENQKIPNGIGKLLTAMALDPDGDELTYYWFVNDQVQSGEQDSTFTFIRSPEVETDFVVSVETSDGIRVTEASCTITVAAPQQMPVISIQENEIVARNGEIAVYTTTSVVPEGKTLTYRWLADDELLVGETEDSLTIVRTPAEETTYTIRVEVEDGTYTSFDTAVLMVEAPKSGIIYGGEYRIGDYEGVYGSSGTSDGLISPGETLLMSVLVRNQSGTNRTGVTGTLSVENEALITVDPARNSYTFGNISDSYYAAAGTVSTFEKIDLNERGTLAWNDYRITVSDAFPVGENITFIIDFIDDNLDTWQDSFRVPVTATGAVIEYAGKFFTYDGGSYGTVSTIPNDILDPGETVRLDIAIFNSGTGGVHNLQCIASEISPYLEIVLSSADFGNLLPLYYDSLYDSRELNLESISLAANAETLILTLGSDCPVGEELDLTLDFTDEWGNTWQDGFTITVGEVY
jgi:hypothetical protein